MESTSTAPTPTPSPKPTFEEAKDAFCQLNRGMSFALDILTNYAEVRATHSEELQEVFLTALGAVNNQQIKPAEKIVFAYFDVPLDA